jgi:hypothetical protein
MIPWQALANSVIGPAMNRGVLQAEVIHLRTPAVPVLDRLLPILSAFHPVKILGKRPSRS